MSALLGFESYGNRDDSSGGNKRWSDMVQSLKETAGDSAYAAARGILFELYAHIQLRKDELFKVSVIWFTSLSELSSNTPKPH